MLQLVSKRPDWINLNVQHDFSSLNVAEHIGEINDLLKTYESAEILNIDSIESGDRPESIVIRGKFGKTNLEKVSTGMKVLIYALISKSKNEKFCCPEFLIGANYLPALDAIASDCDLISLWTPRLDLSAHYNGRKQVQILADGKVKTICF